MPAAVALLIAGCGGDDDALGAEEYRTELNGICQDAYAELQELPTRVAQEDLDQVGATEIGEQIGEDLAAAIGSLEPPDELTDPHVALVESFEIDPPAGSDIDDAIAYVNESKGLYEDLGASECVSIQDESLRGLEAAGQ